MPRQALRLRPIHSLKHVVDLASAAVPGGVVTTFPLADATDSPAANTPNQVAVGATINSVYMQVETVHNSGTFVTTPRIYMIVFKNPGNNLTAPYPASVGTSDNRRYVIHQEMLMQTGTAAESNAFPRTMFKGVIVLPRGYRRFGVDDELSVNFALDSTETTATVSVCIQAIYKEFT